MSRDGLLEKACAVLDAGGDEAQRRSAFPEFASQHPTLFRILCSGRCDLSQLAFMLAKMDAIDAGQLTVEEANTDVFDKLNSKYIDPVLPALTPERLAEMEAAHETDSATRDEGCGGGSRKRLCADGMTNRT